MNWPNYSKANGKSMKPARTKHNTKRTNNSVSVQISSSHNPHDLTPGNSHQLSCKFFKSTSPGTFK